MKAATFEAKYDGKCATCGEVIRSGEKLTWDDDTAVHLGCLDGPSADRVRPTCPDCWEQVALNGSCGCDPS